MDINELNAKIVSLNKQINELNTERDRNIGKREAFQRQYEGMVAEYEKAYGVKLTPETLAAEIESVRTAKEEEVQRITQALALIEEGKCADAEYLLTGKKPEETVGAVDVNGGTVAETATPKTAEFIAVEKPASSDIPKPDVDLREETAETVTETVTETVASGAAVPNIPPVVPPAPSVGVASENVSAPSGVPAPPPAAPTIPQTITPADIAAGISPIGAMVNEAVGIGTPPSAPTTNPTQELFGDLSPSNYGAGAVENQTQPSTPAGVVTPPPTFKPGESPFGAMAGFTKPAQSAPVPEKREGDEEGSVTPPPSKPTSFGAVLGGTAFKGV